MTAARSSSNQQGRHSWRSPNPALLLLLLLLHLLLCAKAHGANYTFRAAPAGAVTADGCITYWLQKPDGCTGVGPERAWLSCLEATDSVTPGPPLLLVAEQDDVLFVLDQGGTRRTTSTTSSALPAGAQGPSSSAASGNNDSSVGGSGGDGGGGAAGLTALAYGVQAELDGLMPGLGGRVVQLGMDAYEQELLAAVGGLAGGSVDNSTGGGGGTGLAVASVAGARWGSYAGFPLSPPVTALLAADARPLDDLLQRDDGGELEWTDINLFFREVAAVYGGRVISIPYTAEIPLLMYREDVLEAYGLQPPATWHEYLHVASLLHGKPMTISNGSTVPIAGWCEFFPPGCSYDGITLLSIWSSMAARQGEHAGVFFDPKTMRSRLPGEAMQEALRIFRAMHEFALEPHPPSCERHPLQYITSRCAMVPVVSTMWKLAVRSGGSFLHSRLRVARMPGSELVESSDTGKLTRCDPQLCPYAEEAIVRGPEPSIATRRSLGPASVEAAAATTTTTADVSRSTLVNFAPFLGRGALSFAIARQADAVAQYAAWRAVVRAMAPDKMWSLVLNPDTPYSPVRDSHMRAINVDRWVSAGYDRDATLNFLGVFQGVVLHPNTVAPPRIPGSEALSRIVASTATVLQYTNATEAQLVQDLATSLSATFNASDPELRRKYWIDIGYRPSVDDFASAEARSGGLTHAQAAGLSVGLAGGAVLLAVLLVLLACNRAQLRERLGLRMTSAPTYGPNSSLMITDIQDSTKLWEQLDEEVMDTALELHNCCIRRIVASWRGYECHTEGDSFVLAFHAARDAVACALEVQGALLHLDWPERLLQTDSCRPVGALPPPPPTAPPTPGGISLTLRHRSRSNQHHHQQLQTHTEHSGHGGEHAQGQEPGRLQVVGLGGGGGREAVVSLTSGSWRLAAAPAGGDGHGGASDAGETPQAGQANASAGALVRPLSHQHQQLHNDVVAALQHNLRHAATVAGMEGLAAGSSNAGGAVGLAPWHGAAGGRQGLPLPAAASGASPGMHTATFGAAATAAAAAAANSQLSRPYYHHHHNQHSNDSTRASLVGGSSRATPTTFRSSTFNTMPSDLLLTPTRTHNPATTSCAELLLANPHAQQLLHPDPHHHSRTHSGSSLITLAGGSNGGAGGGGVATSDAHAQHGTVPYAVAPRQQTGSTESPRPSTEGTLLSTGQLVVVPGYNAQGAVSVSPARGLHRLSASALPAGSRRASMEAAAAATAAASAWPALAAAPPPSAAAAPSSALAGALWCSVAGGSNRLRGVSSSSGNVQQRAAPAPAKAHSVTHTPSHSSEANIRLPLAPSHRLTVRSAMVGAGAEGSPGEASTARRVPNSRRSSIVVFEEAWNEAEEQLRCAELAAAAAVYGDAGGSGLDREAAAQGPVRCSPSLLSAVSPDAAEPSLALPQQPLAEGPTAQQPPGPEIAGEGSISAKLDVLLPSMPPGAQPIQAFAQALTAALPPKAPTHPTRHQPQPPTQQQQLLQPQSAQVAKQGGEGPGSAQQPVRAASCGLGLARALVSGLGADGVEVDGVDADGLGAGEVGLELAEDSLPPLSDGLTHELSFVPMARPPPPPPLFFSAPDAPEDGGLGRKQQHSGLLPHQTPGTGEDEGSSASNLSPFLLRPRSAGGLRTSTTNTVLPSRESAEEQRPEDVIQLQSGGANTVSGTQESMWLPVLAAVESFPAGAGIPAPIRQQDFVFGPAQTDAATSAAKSRSRSGQLLPRPTPLWPEHGAGGAGLVAAAVQARSPPAANAVLADNPHWTTNTLSIATSATATGVPGSAAVGAQTGPSRSWRASLVSGEFPRTAREPSASTASQHSPNPHLHHFRTFAHAASNQLSSSNTTSFRNATTTSVLNAAATAPHSGFFPAPLPRSVDLHRTSAALVSRNLPTRPSAHIFKRLGQAFAAPSSSSASLGAVGSGAGSGTQPTRGTAHGISDHFASSRLFSRGRKHAAGAGASAAAAAGDGGCPGPRERRTYRQQLLQMCYCQASGGGTLGFAASARHTSIAALLQPWLPSRPSLDAGSRGHSQQLVGLPSARVRPGRGRGGSSRRRNMTGHVPGVARAEEQVPSSSGDPEGTDTGLGTSNDEQVATAAGLFTFGTLGILGTLDAGSPLDLGAGPGGAAGATSGLLLVRTTSRGSSQSSFEVSGLQVSRAAATLPSMAAGTMPLVSQGRVAETSPVTASGGHSGASGDEQAGSEALLTSGHFLPAARGSRGGLDEAGGRGSSQGVGAGVPQAPHSERLTARGLAGRLRTWVGKALPRDPRVSGQGGDGGQGQGARGQQHRSMWSAEHPRCSGSGADEGTGESHATAAQHAGARAPADADPAKTPPAGSSSPDATLPYSNCDTAPAAVSRAPGGSGGPELSQQASRSRRRQASPTDRRSVHVMDGARLAAAVAAGGRGGTLDPLQLLVRRAASHTAVLSRTRGLTPQRRLPYPRQASGLGPVAAAPPSQAAAFAFGNATPATGGGPAVLSISGGDACTQRAAPSPGLGSTGGGVTAGPSTSGAGSCGSSCGVLQVFPGNNGGGNDPRVVSPDATVTSTAHPPSDDGSTASGASPQLSPPPEVLLSPPQQLASSRMLHRRNSMEALWPGMFVNPLAAYGPSGPSRFFAAEVLHEINATRGAVTGLGTESNNQQQPQPQQQQTTSGQGSASCVASGVTVTGAPGDSPPSRELGTTGGLAATNTVRSLRGSGFTSRARMLLGLGPGKGVARGRDGGQGSEAEAQQGPVVPGQGSRVHAQRSAMSMTQLREVLRLGSFTAGARTNVLAGMLPKLVAQQQLLLASPGGGGVVLRAGAGAGTGVGAGGQLLPLPPQAHTGGVVQVVRCGALGSMSSMSLGRAGNEAVAHEEAQEAGQAQQQQQRQWRQRQGQLSDVHTEEGPAAVRETVAPRPHSTELPRSVYALHAHSRNVSQVSLRPALGSVGELEAAFLPTPTAMPGVACPSLTQTQGAASASSMGTAVQAPHGHSQGHGHGGFVSRLMPHRRASGTGHTVPPSHLCFRGFRVRVGISSGLVRGRDVVWLKLSGRVAYSGYCMQMTKLVSDAGHGGMLLLSGDAWAALHGLSPGAPAPASGGLPEELAGARALHCGRYRLQDGREAAQLGAGPAEAAAARGGGEPSHRCAAVVTDVYQLVSVALLPRLAHWEQDAGGACALRYGRQLLPGLCDAFLGRVALVRLGVVGVPLLRAWDAEVAAESLRLWEDAVVQQARRWDGYVASLEDGSALVAFVEPVCAIAFAFALQSHLREGVAWPEALLEHHLGEPLVLPTCCFRGLRTRAAVDIGTVGFETAAPTGRALYELLAAKQIKRLAAMGGKAQMGQVLCRGSVAQEVLQTVASMALAVAPQRQDSFGLLGGDVALGAAQLVHAINASQSNRSVSTDGGGGRGAAWVASGTGTVESEGEVREASGVAVRASASLVGQGNQVRGGCGAAVLQEEEEIRVVGDRLPLMPPMPRLQCTTGVAQQQQVQGPVPAQQQLLLGLRVSPEDQALVASELLPRVVFLPMREEGAGASKAASKKIAAAAATLAHTRAASLGAGAGVAIGGGGGFGSGGGEEPSLGALLQAGEHTWSFGVGGTAQGAGAGGMDAAGVEDGQQAPAGKAMHFGLPVVSADAVKRTGTYLVVLREVQA